MAIIGTIIGIVGLISAQMLTRLSEELHETDIESAGITSVLNAHYNWRQNLTEAVLTGSDFTGSLDPETCALGKWTNSEEAKNISDPEIRAMFDKLKAPHEFIHNDAKTVVTYMQLGDIESARREVINVILPQTQEVITILSEMEDRYAEMTEGKSKEILQLGQFCTILILMFMVAAFVASVILTLTITASVINPLRNITTAAESIAKGDLSAHVDYKVDDQIGLLVKSFQTLADNTKAQAEIAEALADGDLTVEITPRSDKDVMNLALQKMLGSLNEMFVDIKAAASQVAADASQISSGAQALAQGSAQQADTVSGVLTSISEISERTKANAELARLSASKANEIMHNAEKGNRQMDEMTAAVNEINQASQSISKVIKVIDDIAFQTNILALNAAVEAARAGQHGKGFAVVAEEVRNLAAKSAEAAKDTGGLIANSIEKAELGARIAQETAASFVGIVSGISESNKIASEIANSSEEQTSGIARINDSIGQVAQVTHESNATAEESAAASEELSAQSHVLDQLISQFKLKGQLGLGVGSL